MRLLLGCLFALFALPLQALPEPQLMGQVTAGPTLFRVDVVEDGTTTQEIGMYGIRGDGTFLPFKDSGFAIKPTGSYGRGDGDFVSYGIGVGYYIPFCESICKNCYFVPIAGLSWTDLRTHIDLAASEFNPALPDSLIFRDIREKFDSNSRYLGFELMCQVSKSLWTTFVYQYAWASGDTVLQSQQLQDVLGLPDGKFVSKGQTQGSNFALVFDYYFNDNVLMQIAGGVNTSLDENRFGIRAYGLKLGIGYYFNP